MHRSSVDDWVGFYDEVIVQGGDWAPEAWFEAVGDAMAGALPADSPILDTYRRRVDELMTLERAATGNEEDERRIAALEAEIQRLIGAADEVIRTRRTVPARTEPVHEMIETPPPPRPRRGYLRAALTTVVALILIGTGLLAALYVYDARLVHKIDQELDRYVAELRTTVTTVQAELEAQAGRSLEEQERLRALQADLVSDMAVFDEELDESMAKMAGLAEDAGRDLERRLRDQSGEVVLMLDGLARRAGVLDREIGDVGAEIADLERELPALGDRLSRLSLATDEGRAAFEETMQRVAALKTLAPEIERLASRERQVLDSSVDAAHARLEDVQTGITELGETYRRSGAELAAARETVEQELVRGEEARARLRTALGQIETAARMVDEMRRSAEAELTTTQAVLRERTEKMLSDLAETADLAVLRGDDVLKRAEQRVVGRIDTAGDAAMGAFEEARERELATLADGIAATRHELDRTRDELTRSWRRMDDEMAERHEALLDELDAYAAAVEDKVAELTRSLDVAARADTSISP